MFSTGRKNAYFNFHKCAKAHVWKKFTFIVYFSGGKSHNEVGRATACNTLLEIAGTAILYKNLMYLGFYNFNFISTMSFNPKPSV